MTTTTHTIIDQFKAARRVSTPLVAINTPDQAATIKAICDAVNGEAPKIQWDFARGLSARSESGATAIATIVGEFDPTQCNPLTFAQRAVELPENSIVFMLNAHRWLTEPGVMQGVWNLRDQFKGNRRTLVLMGIAVTLPPELGGDVVTLEEPLPNPSEIESIIREVHESAGLKPAAESVTHAVEALTGLPAFQVEQVAAMSLTKKGLDLPALWERKRQQIEQTPGLKVYREGETFSDVGGVAVVKDFLSRIMRGNARPNAVVFVDEIEKMIAGAGGDTSGVSQDQLGSLLAYMQDRAAAGMIFIGPPGSAKSMIAKAAGTEGGIPTIQLDLGAAKGSLVGQSEQQLRAALKVITAVSNGRSLWIATCNSIQSLPPELRRRFTLGTFFFDLPDPEERKAIWKIHAQRFDIAIAGSKDLPNDNGWTGAEIRQCCDIAWRLGITLKEAAKFIVPVSVSAKDQLDNLRRLADGRFLSASKGGIYQVKPTGTETAAPKRQIHAN